MRTKNGQNKDKNNNFFTRLYVLVLITCQKWYLKYTPVIKVAPNYINGHHLLSIHELEDLAATVDLHSVLPLLEHLEIYAEYYALLICEPDMNFVFDLIDLQIMYHKQNQLKIKNN